jgi:hypothetical protein
MLEDKNTLIEQIEDDVTSKVAESSKQRSKKLILWVASAVAAVFVSIAGVNYANQLAAEGLESQIRAADVLACETLDKVDTRSNPHAQSALYAYTRVETFYLGRLNKSLTSTPPKSPELAEAFLDLHRSTSQQLNAFADLLTTIKNGETMSEYGKRMRLAGRQYEALRLVDLIDGGNWKHVQDLIAVQIMCAATTYESTN